MADKTQQLVKKTIVLLEDNSTICDGVERRLKIDFQNHRAISDNGGEMCVEKITTKSRGLENIALVIADGTLVGTTGWEVAEKLKHRGYSNPILYYGASEVPVDKKGLFNSTSSKDYEELLTVIRGYLHE